MSCVSPQNSFIHELKSPLNAVLCLSHMLQNEGDMGIDAAKRLEYTKIIHENCQYVLQLIEDMQALQMLEGNQYPLHIESLKAAEIIDQTVLKMKPKAREHGISLHVICGETRREFTADKRAFTQIITQLLQNAIKNTQKSGSITVQLRQDEHEIQLMVADTSMANIGSEGLAIVRKLVALHNGEMSISHPQNNGTITKVTMPLIHAAQEIAWQAKIAA